MPSAFKKLQATLVTALGGVMLSSTQTVTVASTSDAGTPGTTSVTATSVVKATAGIIVYGASSQIIRRVILPDNDSQLGLHKPKLLAGELSVTAPLSQEIDLVAVKAVVQQATGVAPPSGRAALVDATNTVISILQADPALDTHPSGTLVSSDIAINDDLWRGGTAFSRLYATVDQSSNKVAAVGFQPAGQQIAGKGFYVVEAGKLQVGDDLSSPTPVTVNPK